MTTIQTLMRIRAALPPVSTRRCTEGKRKAPGTSEAFKELTCRGIQGSRCPWTLRYYPKAQIGQGAEPNATGRVGADGETGDFKGLTLSNPGPVFLGSRGFFFRQGADRVSAPTRRLGNDGPGLATTCSAGRVVTKRTHRPAGGPAGRACHNASPSPPTRHGRDDPKQKNAGF